MTDILPEAQSKSGQILKAAREEMSLTLEQVANELHLRPSVIKAIEEESYDKFTSDVFLKGYFRTYCRLVNLHEARMMDLLEQQLTARQKQAENIKQLANKELQTKKRKKLFVVLSVLFVFLFLIAFAYQMVSKEHNDASDITEANNVNIINADKVQETSVKETGRIESITPVDQKNVSTEKVDLEEQNQVLNVTDKLDTLNDGASKIAEASEELADNQLDDSLVPLKSDDLAETDDSEIQTVSENLVSNVSTLKAIFSGDCWFKVTDSNGKTVIAALKKADDEVNYKGSAPFNIVIGDASKINLFFEDELVNLRPFTSRNGRAELTLKPSDSDNEG